MKLHLFTCLFKELQDKRRIVFLNEKSLKKSTTRVREFVSNKLRVSSYELRVTVDCTSYKFVFRYEWRVTINRTSSKLLSTRWAMPTRSPEKYYDYCNSWHLIKAMIIVIFSITFDQVLPITATWLVVSSHNRYKMLAGHEAQEARRSSRVLSIYLRSKMLLSKTKKILFLGKNKMHLLHLCFTLH